MSDYLSTLAPEIILGVWALVALMWGSFGGGDRLAGPITWATAAVMLVLSVWSGVDGGAARTAFDGAIVNDAVARYAKFFVLFSAALVLLIGHDQLVRRGAGRFEYAIVAAFSVLGMMLMVSAGDLMSLYLGLELQSLSLYILTAFRRDSVRSAEAGLKYFVLGALSSGLLLYGASLTYGYAGTTLFTGIAAAADGGHVGIGLLFGLAFMMAGLAFKVSAVPFHMWTPDVYQGAPTPVTAFLATAPKVAAMVMLARLLHTAFAEAVADWQQILVLLSLLTMFVGAIGAIAQRDIKRLMAYSSITHMGFALMGLAAGTATGLQAMLIYMAIYVLMNIGTFAFILTMTRDGEPVADIDSLNLYARRDPKGALALLVLLFSLAGVPPLVGFFGKFYVLVAAVEAGLGWLAVAGVIASVIAAFYYLRIVYYMYFGQEGEALDAQMGGVQRAVLAAMAIAMVVGVVNLFGIDGWAAIAAGALAG